MSSCQFRKSHCGDKMVLRSSYLHIGISCTGKMASLYGIIPQVVMYYLYNFVYISYSHVIQLSHFGINVNTAASDWVHIVHDIGYPTKWVDFFMRSQSLLKWWCLSLESLKIQILKSFSKNLFKNWTLLVLKLHHYRMYMSIPVIVCT